MEESRVVKDSAENRNPIEDEDAELARIKKLIEEAETLEECLACRKCENLLDILKKIALDARERLVHIDPNMIKNIIQLQQTAKIFDAVTMSIKNTVMEGQLALDEISDREEPNG